MSFFEKLGKAVGTVAGGVIGGTVSLVGDIVGSEFINEIGEGAYRVTANTGKRLGIFADGAVNCASGIIQKDNSKVSDGAKKMFDTTADTVVGIGKGIVSTVNLGAEGVGAILDGDEKKVVEVGKKMVKIATISALSFSILDVVDGTMDGSILDNNHNGVPDFLEDGEAHLIDNPNIHSVTPHYRQLASGDTIWVDGDGDTSVDTFDGWSQHNPDYRV